MLVDQINLNQLRVFERVYQSQSMTIAAKELSLTQSGVSQHIRSLEDVLQVKLFDRVKRKIYPTSEASQLFRETVRLLHGVEKALSELQPDKKKLRGTVQIGMPKNFGNKVLLPLVSEFIKENPLVGVNLSLGFAQEMTKKVLEGELDFAFVDAFGLDKSISQKKVFTEELVLCASKEYLAQKKPISETKDFFETLDYIVYADEAPVLKVWMKQNMRSRVYANVRAVVKDTHAVAALIGQGVGVGVLPSYFLDEIDSKENRIHRFKGLGRPVKNVISIVELSDRSKSPAVEELMKFLRLKLK